MNDVPPPSPYRSTPVFDEHTLPAALRREHQTKQGVWAVIRVLEGRLKLRLIDTGEERTLAPGSPAIVTPAQPHLVEALGAIRMQVDFYDRRPDPDRLDGGLRG